MFVKLLIVLLALVVVAWLVTRFYLGGPNLAKYDQPHPVLQNNHPPSEGHARAVDDLAAMHKGVSGQTKSFGDRVMAMRKVLDNMGDKVDLTGFTITPTTIGEISAEWVTVDGQQTPSRRLLYIHGGSFFAGSPKSHRSVTTALARYTKSAVLAIDYRMLPESTRFDSVADCKEAYRWMVDNGPQGAGNADQVLIAGDSAGGNLTLVTSAWARDDAVRTPDAVIAISPATDGTMSGPSMINNIPTDPMIGPSIGKVMKTPRSMLLWAVASSTKALPHNTALSPIHGDLSGLPPTLIHVSAAEMLYDDARRYANKAIAAGSPVTLQAWPHAVHVWHIYQPDMPEANEALEAIAQFVENTLPASH